MARATLDAPPHRLGRGVLRRVPNPLAVTLAPRAATILPKSEVPLMLRNLAVMAGLIALFTALAKVGLMPSNPQDRMLVAATVVAFAMLALSQTGKRRGP